MDYDLFNGDADGICALIQLRMAQPREAQLVTGVKRHINLLDDISPTAGDRVTVLDVSMEKNARGLRQALASGASVFYVDHHFPGEIPDHPNLQAIVNESATVCTAILVNGHLRNRYPRWAVAGGFGDNLRIVAAKLAEANGISGADTEALQHLGECINYNGYGAAVEDLHFAPDALYRSLYAAQDPLRFVHESPDYQRLSDGYAADMAQVQGLKCVDEIDTAAVFVLPNAAWARRVSGVFGNDLAANYPNRAHAVLTEKADGGMQVSVRAPMSKREGAVDLCRQFPSGGGRAAAAGINHLPSESVADFVAKFFAAYGA
ncbi:MAG: acetyltransferase [Gammaproteobacteria bacterium]|nr:MAG: acetyltransferase [Gammaproteobacteria bacterium]